jgi:hypothetical protein
VRLSPKSLLVLGLFLAACKSNSNPLIGTWLTADQPVPAGCSTKIVFTDKTMYYESPGIPNLLPASSGTVNIAYGGDPNNPKQLVVQNVQTGVLDDWDLTDATHAISGSVAQCHYVKQ